MVTSHVQDFNGRDLSYLSTVQSEEYTAEPAIAGCLKCCFQRQSVRMMPATVHSRSHLQPTEAS